MMTKGMKLPKPTLQKFPNLHAAVSNPATAAEFNEFLSSLFDNVRGRSGSEMEIAELKKQLRTMTDRHDELQRHAAKMLRFIKLLGEVIEPQVELKPWSLEITIGATHSIKFSAGQIRMVLKLFWDSVSERMEKTILKGVDVVDDPAAERDAVAEDEEEPI